MLEFVARGAGAAFRGSKYSWRERWCIADITLRSVKYIRGYLPSVKSVSSCASGVLAGVASRGSGKGGPLRVPSAARRVFAKTLSGGGGGVAGGRVSPIRTGFCSGVVEGLTDPLCAGWGATG